MSNAWYPRYYGDYTKGTQHLTLAEHGAYTKLLDHYYATGQPLPDDATALLRTCAAMTPEERAAVESVAAQFFPVNGDGMRHNKRADREIEKLAVRSESARGSANQRWHSNGKAGVMRTQCERNAIHNPQSTVHIPEAKDHKPMPPDGGEPAEKKPRERNPLMDALGTLDAPDLREMNKAGWKRVGVALSQIKESTPDVTPEEIARRARNYRSHFEGAACTSTALAKHWARCKDAANKSTPSDSGLVNTWHDPNPDMTMRNAW